MQKHQNFWIQKVTTWYNRLGCLTGPAIGVLGNPTESNRTPQNPTESIDHTIGLRAPCGPEHDRPHWDIDYQGKERAEWLLGKFEVCLLALLDEPVSSPLDSGRSLSSLRIPSDGRPTSQALNDFDDRLQPLPSPHFPRIGAPNFSGFLLCSLGSNSFTNRTCSNQAV